MGKNRSADSRSLSRKVQSAFGTKLKAARRQSKPKVTQSAIAEALDITRTSISNIENGRHRVFLDQVYAAAERLRVPVASLLPDEAEILTNVPVSVSPTSGLTVSETERLAPYVEEALRKATMMGGHSRQKARD